MNDRWGRGNESGRDDLDGAVAERLVYDDPGNCLGASLHRLVANSCRRGAEIGAVGGDQKKSNTEPKRGANDHRKDLRAGKCAVRKEASRLELRHGQTFR